MAQSLNSFLDGLTSYYRIGQPAPIAERPYSRSSGSTHYVPVYGPAYSSPFIYGCGGSGGRAVSVIASGDAETVRKHEREDREESRQTAAAVIGGICTIAFAALSAYLLKGYSEDCKELQKAIEFRNSVIPTLSRYQASQIAPIANKHIEILEAKCALSRSVALLAGGILASSAAAFVGGMFAMSGLITASIVSGVALAALGAFSTVWHYSDERTLPVSMQQQVQELRQNRGWFSGLFE